MRDDKKAPLQMNSVYIRLRQFVRRWTLLQITHYYYYIYYLSLVLQSQMSVVFLLSYFIRVFQIEFRLFAARRQQRRRRWQVPFTVLLLLLAAQMRTADINGIS